MANKGVPVGQAPANERPPLYGLPPLLVTLAELREILAPLTLGYKWGESTIDDLWRMGAPTPGSVCGTPGEVRIVFPGQLGKWLVDVLERQGLPLDAAAEVYLGLRERSR